MEVVLQSRECNSMLKFGKNTFTAYINIFSDVRFSIEIFSINLKQV